MLKDHKVPLLFIIKVCGQFCQIWILAAKTSSGIKEYLKIQGSSEEQTPFYIQLRIWEFAVIKMDYI